jgi:hypothetical protein
MRCKRDTVLLIFSLQNKFLFTSNMVVSGLTWYRYDGEMAMFCGALSKSGNDFFLPNVPPLNGKYRRE